MSDLFQTIPEGFLRDRGRTQSDHSLHFLCQQFMNLPCFCLSLPWCACLFASEREVGRGDGWRERERERRRHMTNDKAL